MKGTSSSKSRIELTYLSTSSDDMWTFDGLGPFSDEVSFGAVDGCALSALMTSVSSNDCQSEVRIIIESCSNLPS